MRRVTGHALGRRRRTDAVVGVLTVAAGLAYSLFLLTPVLGASLDPATSFVSELAAIDQPTSTVFRIVDGFVGLVLVLGGVHLATRARGLPRRWAGASLALFGLATLLDAVLPMTCAPSADPVCAAAEAGRTATSFGLHEVTSVSANLAAIVAIFLLAAARFRRPLGGPSTPSERVFLGALTVVVATGVVVVLNETVGSGLEAVVGYVQRAQVLALSVVIVTVGLVTLGRARVAR